MPDPFKFDMESKINLNDITKARNNFKLVF